MPSLRSRFGASAEIAAGRWLENSGYRILERNWRRPWGELDIVALKDGVIHFVEVKASAQNNQGFEPYVRAGVQKMLKVQRTARTWLASHQKGEDTEWQIDVLSVILNPEKPFFELFENI